MVLSRKAGLLITFFLILISPVFSDRVPRTLKDVYYKCSHVVKARCLERPRPVYADMIQRENQKPASYVGFRITKFEVLKEYRGVVIRHPEVDNKKMIYVIENSSHPDKEFKGNRFYKKGTEYFLFLQITTTPFLFTSYVDGVPFNFSSIEEEVLQLPEKVEVVQKQEVITDHYTGESIPVEEEYSIIEKEYEEDPADCYAGTPNTGAVKHGMETVIYKDGTVRSMINYLYGYPKEFYYYYKDKDILLDTLESYSYSQGEYYYDSNSLYDIQYASYWDEKGNKVREIYYLRDNGLIINCSFIKNKPSVIHFERKGKKGLIAREVIEYDTEAETKMLYFDRSDKEISRKKFLKQCGFQSDWRYDLNYMLKIEQSNHELNAKQGEETLRY